MKKLLILIVIALSLASCKQSNVKITGLVHNPTSGEIEIFYYTDFIKHETESTIAGLNEENEFSLELPLDKNTFVFMKMDERQYSLYLKPGSRLYIEFDMENPDEKPHISGDNVFESHFMVCYNNDILKEFNRGFIMNNAEELDAEEFTKLAEDIKNISLDYLQNYLNYDELDIEFINYHTHNINYQYYNNLLNYPAMHQHFNRLEELPELPENYYDILDIEGIINDEAIATGEYRNFLVNYLNYNMRIKPFDRETMDNYFKYQYELAEEIFAGQSLEHMLASITVMALSRTGFEDAEEIYNNYISIASPGANKEVVKKQYELVLNLLPGNPAPDFTFAGLDGDLVSLSDFAGKVVYLDFWASWCGPCIREIPFAKELKERMKEQENLVFLYVSVDDKEEAWRNAIENHGMEGVHIHAGGWDNLATKAYNVSGIPTYYVIGRDGNIFDNRPPRPSNEKIDDVLLEALKID